MNAVDHFGSLREAGFHAAANELDSLRAEVDRLRALLAGRDTPTPDPPEGSGGTLAVEQAYGAGSMRTMDDPYRAAAVPVQEPTPCHSQSPIFKGDTGPVYCDRPAGHTGDHWGHDADNRYHPRRNWPVQEPTCTTCGDLKRVPCRSHFCVISTCAPCPVCDPQALDDEQ